MKDITFVWDPEKDIVNQSKHNGVSFAEAKTVFYDENARVIYDPDHSIDEDRFIIIGLSSRFRILVVCHCYRENDSLIRLISARRASSSEIKAYEGHRNA